MNKYLLIFGGEIVKKRYNQSYNWGKLTDNDFIIKYNSKYGCDDSQPSNLCIGYAAQSSYSRFFAEYNKYKFSIAYLESTNFDITNIIKHIPNIYFDNGNKLMIDFSLEYPYSYYFIYKTNNTLFENDVFKILERSHTLKLNEYNIEITKDTNTKVLGFTKNNLNKEIDINLYFENDINEIKLFEDVRYNYLKTKEENFWKNKNKPIDISKLFKFDKTKVIDIYAPKHVIESKKIDGFRGLMYVYNMDDMKLYYNGIIGKKVQPIINEKQFIKQELFLGENEYQTLLDKITNIEENNTLMLKLFENNQINVEDNNDNKAALIHSGVSRSSEYLIIIDFLNDILYKYHIIQPKRTKYLYNQISQIEFASQKFIVGLSDKFKYDEKKVDDLSHAVCLASIFAFIIFTINEEKKTLFNDTKLLQSCEATIKLTQTHIKTKILHISKCIIEKLFNEIYFNFKTNHGGNWTKIIEHMITEFEKKDFMKYVSLRELYPAYIDEIDKLYKSYQENNVTDKFLKYAMENYFDNKIRDLYPGENIKNKEIKPYYNTYKFVDKVTEPINNIFDQYTDEEKLYNIYNYCPNGMEHEWNNSVCENCNLKINELSLYQYDWKDIKSKTLIYNAMNKWKLFCPDFKYHDIKYGICINCKKTINEIHDPKDMNQIIKHYRKWELQNKHNFEYEISNFSKEYSPKHKLKDYYVNINVDDLNNFTYSLENLKSSVEFNIIIISEKFKSSYVDYYYINDKKKEAVDELTNDTMKKKVEKSYTFNKYYAYKTLLNVMFKYYRSISNNYLLEEDIFQNKYLKYSHKFKINTQKYFEQINDLDYINMDINNKINSIMNIGIEFMKEIKHDYEKYFMYEYIITNKNHMDMANITEMFKEINQLDKIMKNHLRHDIEMALSPDEKRDVGFEYMSLEEKNKYLDKLIDEKEMIEDDIGDFSDSSKVKFDDDGSDTIDYDGTDQFERD